MIDGEAIAGHASLMTGHVEWGKTSSHGRQRRSGPLNELGMPVLAVGTGHLKRSFYLSRVARFRK